MIDGGLVLEGGGMRGLYTAGVLDVLLDEGIFFKNNYGVSAGVCHACSYLSRQKGRAMRTVVDFVKDKRYAGAYSLLTSGDFFGVKMIYDEIPNKLLPFDYETFANKEETLWAVLTDCLTGEPAYHRVEDLRQDMDLIRASSSLPMLSRKVEVDGVKYLDGGIADSIPIRRAVEDGNRKNLVVLTQHDGYRKKTNQLMPLLRVRYRAWPQLVESIATRHRRYNDALHFLKQQRDEGAAYVIQPARKVEVDRLEKDVEKLKALYRQGVEDAKVNLPALRIFFNL